MGVAPAHAAAWNGPLMPLASRKGSMAAAMAAAASTEWWWGSAPVASASGGAAVAGSTLGGASPIRLASPSPACVSADRCACRSACAW